MCLFLFVICGCQPAEKETTDEPVDDSPVSTAATQPDMPTYQDILTQACMAAGIEVPVQRAAQMGVFYDPFPVVLRGTSMSRADQLEYFSGHMVLDNFGTFGGIASGVTGCDVYEIIYEVIDYWDTAMAPIGGYLPYMVDVQETNRFSMFGPGGYDVPDVIDIEVPCT